MLRRNQSYPSPCPPPTSEPKFILDCSHQLVGALVVAALLDLDQKLPPAGAAAFGDAEIEDQKPPPAGAAAFGGSSPSSNPSPCIMTRVPHPSTQLSSDPVFCCTACQSLTKFAPVDAACVTPEQLKRGIVHQITHRDKVEPCHERCAGEGRYVALLHFAPAAACFAVEFQHLFDFENLYFRISIKDVVQYTSK